MWRNVLSLLSALPLEDRVAPSVPTRESLSYVLSWVHGPGHFPRERVNSFRLILQEVCGLQKGKEAGLDFLYGISSASGFCTF